MEFSDFYCSKDTLGKRIGYVLPWDVGEQLKGHHCIGLVARVGQNQDDLSDYSQSGIKKSNCQGYVISLTDTFSEPFLVNHGSENVLPWGSDSVNEEIFTLPIEQKINEWSGYYNHHKIIEYAKNTAELTLRDFPAAYTCEYYVKYTLGTNENGEPIWVSEGSSTGLEAPDNTSGWFLPTVHMLYSVSGRNGFTIGGKEYFTDEEGHAIDKLFNDRIELIKKYLGHYGAASDF